MIYLQQVHNSGIVASSLNSKVKQIVQVVRLYRSLDRGLQVALHSLLGDRSLGIIFYVCDWAMHVLSVKS